MHSLKKTLPYGLMILGLSFGLTLTAVAADFARNKALATKGNSAAQYSLGLMYYSGEGLRQDYGKAVKWYQKAANQGMSQAQFNLGVMYYKGQGVRQSKVKAKEFFGKACDNGQQSGCNSYRVLNKKY